MSLLITFLVMFGLMFLGLEIFAAIAAGGMAYLLYSENAPLNLIASIMVQGVSSYSLLAIPFFMLVGELMNASGMTKKVMRLANYFIGSSKGGLAYAAIFINLLMSSISGSAPAVCSAVSSVMLPEMKKGGYPVKFSASLNCSAAILGPILPPSIPMVFVAMLCNLSVGKLFLAGLVPGILLVISLLVYTFFQMRHMDIKIEVKEERSREGLGVAIKDAWLGLMTPVLIVIGVVTGFVTITEVAMISSAYVMVIGVFVYKTITLKTLIAVFKKATLFASALMALFGVVEIFTWFMAVEGVNTALGNFVSAMHLTVPAFLLMVTIVNLISGTFMDAIPAISLFMPVVMPIAIQLGIDPIHFATIVVVNQMIGLLTPPFAALLMVESKISKLSSETLAVAVIPYMAIFIGVLLLITYVPGLVTFLPNLLMG